MNYLMVNYDKLKNLNIKDYYLIVLVVIFIFLYFIFLSCFIKVTDSAVFYGIVDDGLIKVGVDTSFSEKIKKGQKLKFQGTEANYEIEKFGEYQVMDNTILEEVYLRVDEKFYNNEVGEVTIYYNEESLGKYLFKLFK